jgi:hypothetical protein
LKKSGLEKDANNECNKALLPMKGTVFSWC